MRMKNDNDDDIFVTDAYKQLQHDNGGYHNISMEYRVSMKTGIVLIIMVATALVFAMFMVGELGGAGFDQNKACIENGFDYYNESTGYCDWYDVK